MKQIPKSYIDLIYIDPPFGIKADEKFNMMTWKNTSYYEQCVYDMFEKILNDNDLKFLSFLYPRLTLMRDLLSERGSICVHIDWHVGHYVKILMDSIFGKENFVNEIVWSYRSGGASKTKSLSKKHDLIYIYRKSEQFQVNTTYERQYLNKSFMGSKVDKDGRYYVDTLLRDVFEGDINVVNPDGSIKEYNVRPVLNLSKEYSGYPTQKPQGLIELLLRFTLYNENSIIADFFSRSGTKSF